MLDVTATAASGKPIEEVERALEGVLDGLRTAPPSAEELARAKRRTFLALASDLELLNGRGGESGRAGMLQRFNHYLGDPGYLPKWLAALDAVSAEDVVRVVQKYMSREARVTVVTRPTVGTTAVPAASAPGKVQP
jgi:zinc protease